VEGLTKFGRVSRVFTQPKSLARFSLDRDPGLFVGRGWSLSRAALGRLIFRNGAGFAFCDVEKPFEFCRNELRGLNKFKVGGYSPAL
jgi:hypothetical protein